MKMTKTLAVAALVAGSLFAGSTLQAQDSTNTPPAGARPGGGMRGRPNIEQISKQLELTEDQKPKVKTVLDEQQTKMAELRKDTSLEQTDRRAKMKEIRDASTAKLKEILTADQFSKWEKMAQGNRRRAGGQPPADAPKQ